MAEKDSIDFAVSDAKLIETQPPDESPIIDTLERFADFIDEMVDRPRALFHCWEGNADGVAIRSVGRVTTKYRYASKSDRPPYALIVRLAEQLPTVVKKLVEMPKKILQRQRSMESLEHIRELDSTCVRWIARQPGLTLPEKAGHRRSLMAVKRFESSNTLENRVLLSVVRLCKSRCRDYLRRFEGAFAGHQRIKSIREFLRLCEQLLRHPLFTQVTPIDSVPKPNYALLHDKRYRLLWSAFQSLVRQQRRRNLLWQDRNAYFAELFVLGAQAALEEIAIESLDEAKYARRHDLAILENPSYGQVLDTRASIPIWPLRGRGDVWVGREYFKVFPFVGACNLPADLQAVLLRKTPKEVVGFGIRFKLDASGTSTDSHLAIAQITSLSDQGWKKRLALPVDLFSLDAIAEIRRWLDSVLES